MKQNIFLIENNNTMLFYRPVILLTAKQYNRMHNEQAVIGIREKDSTGC